MKSFEATFTTDYDDIREYYYFQFRLILRLSKFLFWLSMFGAALLAVMWTLNYITGRPQDDVAMLSLFFAVIFSFLFLLRFIIGRFPGIITKGKSVIFEEAGIKVSEEGFLREAASSSLIVPWDKMHKVVISKKLFLFYISSLLVFIVPKRLFTAEVCAEIEGIIRGSLPQKKVLTKKF